MADVVEDGCHVPSTVLAIQRQVQALRERIKFLMSLDDPASKEHQELDAELHGMIAGFFENQLLADMIAELRRKTRMFSLKRQDNRLTSVCLENLAMIDALKRGDAVAAAAKTTRHINNIRQSIVDKLLSY